MKYVTVCDKCLTASCWHYEFMCEEYVEAGTVDLPLARLQEMKKEHESYYLNRAFERNDNADT